MTYKKRKAQAALEYLTTYGWAIMGALIAIGALTYFGFLNPTKLLPNRCDFGKQLECVEYRILSEGHVDVVFRNNFGKDIKITDVKGDDILGVNPASPGSLPLTITSGGTGELWMDLNTPYLVGDKKEVNIVIIFRRAGGNYPLHNITGTVFTAVQ